MTGIRFIGLDRWGCFSRNEERRSICTQVEGSIVYHERVKIEKTIGVKGVERGRSCGRGGRVEVNFFPRYSIWVVSRELIVLGLYFCFYLSYILYILRFTWTKISVSLHCNC